MLARAFCIKVEQYRSSTMVVWTSKMSFMEPSGPEVHVVLSKNVFSTAVKNHVVAKLKDVFDKTCLQRKKPLFKRKTSCFFDTFLVTVRFGLGNTH